jgi:hypothetical protein
MYREKEINNPLKNKIYDTVFNEREIDKGNELLKYEDSY